LPFRPAMRILKFFIIVILHIFLVHTIFPSPSFSAEVILFEQTFVRGTGKPVTEEVSFDIPAPAEQYNIIITNGNSDGTNRCSSANADINGIIILVPSDLNQNVYIIERDILLNPVNLLTIELRSVPGCFLNVKIIGIDSTPPDITITSPGNGDILGSSVTPVSGTIDDPYATVTVNGVEAQNSGGSFQATIPLNYGSNTILAEARDFYTNTNLDEITVISDTIPPVITINPIPEYISSSPLELTGSIDDITATTVSVQDQSVSVPAGGGIFSLAVNLTEGFNTIAVQAIDSVGNEGTASVEMTLDTIAPEVTGFSILADPKITLNIPVSITFTEEMDTETISSSNIILQGPSGNVSGSFSISGTEVIFTPDTELAANEVYTLTVNTGVKDRAGNPLAYVFTGTFETLRGPAFILGEVYNDTLGLPIEGAEVQVLLINNEVPDPALLTVTDAMGRFSFKYEGSAGKALIEAQKYGFTKALRTAYVSPNKSFEIFDIRLTPIETQTIQALTGGTLATGDTALNIPANALNQDTAISIALLSQQGMSRRLPIGWSPIYGIDISPWAIKLNTPGTLSIKNIWSITDTSEFIVAFLDEDIMTWISGNASLSGDNIIIEISKLGQYLLLIPDTVPSAPPIPSTAGEPVLPSMDALPDGGTAAVEVLPTAILSQEGAQGMTTVTITTQGPIPSGTPIEARITEKYNLFDGEVILIDPFIQDITLYVWPDDGDDNTLSALFPTTPSKTYPFGTLYYGKVDIDIFYKAVEEELADNVIGENGGTVTGPDGTSIIVPPSSLTDVTVFSLYTLSESELPVSGTEDITFLGALVLQMQGGTFLPDAYPQFIIPGADTDGMEIIITRVETINRESVLTAVATAIVTDAKISINRCLTTECISTGRFAFYNPGRPIGFITGEVYKSGNPVSGVVMTVDNLPFKSITDSSGNFSIVTLSGAYSVSASEPDTGLTAEDTGTIADGESITTQLTLLSTRPEVTEITPHDRATTVDPATRVEVAFSEPIDPSTVDSASFQVIQEQPGINVTPIQVNGYISLKSGNTAAVFTPELELEPDTIYRVRLTEDITDDFGEPLLPFESVFTTAEVLGNEALEPGELMASMPDENGYVTIRGGTGLAAPESPVVLFNRTQGITVTITAELDGSFVGTIQVSLGDKIEVHVEDLLGNVTILDPGLLQNPDGTAAVGPEGGTIYGPDGITTYIPEGAFDEFIAIKVAMVSEDVLQDVSIDPALRNAGVFQVDTGGVTANEELKVSIPAPDWITPEHQILITKVVNIRGFDELTLTSPAVLEDGKIMSTSPPFDGIFEGGTYGMSTWYDPETGVGFAMVETWSYYGAGYVLGDYGLSFAAPEYTRRIFPITVPVNKPYDVILSSLDNTPLDTVSIQGPPVRGEFIEGITKLTDDTVPPEVLISSIPDGSTEILPGENSIIVQMNEPIDPSSVGNNTVFVTDSQGNLAEGYAYIARDGKTIVFVPRYGYKYGQTYTISINGVKDWGGNLISPYTSTFSTFRPEILKTIDVPAAMAIDKYKNYIVVKGVDWAVGDLVYSSVINIIDVTDPRDPQITGSTDLGGYILDLKAVPDMGDYLVAVGGRSNQYGYLDLVDVSDPFNPLYHEFIYLSWSPGYSGTPPENVPYGGGAPYEVTVIGTNAYVANYGIGVQGIDLTAVTPPQETAQATAIAGTIAESSYQAVSKVRNNILAIKNGALSILSPQLSVIGQISGLIWPYGVTGVEAFPIDLDNDGNIGAYEDSDGDSMTSEQETFDLALVLTADGIVIINITNPQSPQKMDMIPVPTGRIVVDREKRLAYTNSLYIISLKDLKPLSNPDTYGVKRDFDNDGIDDRVLYTMPQASGFDMVLSDNGDIAYVADYTGGLVKVVALESVSYIKILDKDERAMEELEFSDGNKPEKQYHVEIKLNSDLNPNNLSCSEISVALKIANDESDLANVTGLYPTVANISLEDLSQNKCRSTRDFIITNLLEGKVENTDIIPLRGGIGNKVKVESTNLNIERDYSVPIEPVGVIVIAIDGLRQDVLYPEGEEQVQDQRGNYYVEPSQLSGLCDVLGGKYDGNTCDTTGWEDKHIKLQNVTAVFPSITLASWASIFTGMMPGTTLDKDGNNIGGTGILGNEFFARDLMDRSVPQRYNNPPGIISFSSGAFKGYDQFRFWELDDDDFFVPYQGDWSEQVDPIELIDPEDPENLRAPQNDPDILKAKTVFESIKEIQGVGSYFSERGGDPVVVANSHYARGAYWLTWDKEAACLFVWNCPSETMDQASWDKFDDYLGGKYLKGLIFKERNDIPFSALTVWYLPGLDHEAHGEGMSVYRDYFINTTDSYIETVVNRLKDLGEFDNKIFIITTDHGFTEMPEFGEVTLPDGRTVEPDTSCKLNVEDFDDIDIQDSEKYNNNLHIWELGEVFEQFPITNTGIELRILTPKEISKVTKGATADINEANVIAAFNGPMAHIYIKGATWKTDPSPEVEKPVASLLYKVFKEGINATGVLKDIASEHFPNIGASIDKILIREKMGDSYVYKVVTNVQEDVLGNAVIETDTLNNQFNNLAYVDAINRIEKMNYFDRSGDIVLIMKDNTDGPVNERYTTGVACKSWHGSLNPSDSYVPLIVTYPGGNRYELEPLINNTEGCDVTQGCDGNWRTTEIIKEIIETQYSGQ